MAEISDELPPRLDPGTHSVMLDHFYTALMFQGKAPKLVLVFTIVSPGPAYGAKLPRYYNVKRIIGRPQTGGRFHPSATSDFAREFYTLFDYGGRRLDRLPMTNFDGKVIQANIATVTRARGQRIPEPLQYSKISKLIKVIEE